MRHFIPPGILLLGCTLLLAACARTKAADQTNSSLSSVASAHSSGQAPSLPIPSSAASGEFTLEGAKEEFALLHADATISVAKQQGDVYYIEGWNGNILYKMKFRISTGEVLLDETVQTGRRTQASAQS